MEQMNYEICFRSRLLQAFKYRLDVEEHKRAVTNKRYSP